MENLNSFSKLYISNSVFTGCTDTTFDLPMIYKYFQITPDYVKIQFNNLQKDTCEETICKTFYNQITFALKNKASVKLFNNGNFQISGVKSMADAKKNLLFVTKDLESIKGIECISPVMIEKVCTYNNKIIVEKEGEYKCKAVYKNGFFIIDGDVCVISDFDHRILISNRHLDKVKNLYNLNCENIGHVSYEMIRKSKNLCLKDSFFTKVSETEYSIFNKYTLLIGSLKIYITGKIVEHKTLKKINIKYNACDKIPEILSINLANINCNIKYKLYSDDVLDREAICRVLVDNNIKYNYDPCKYPGVKVDHFGTKLTIFRTGSILFSGKSDIKKTIEWIAKLFDKNDFTKKVLKKDEDCNQEDFSIWDII